MTEFSLNPNPDNRFFLLAGPCVVENEKLLMTVAEKIKRITERLKIPYVFKASYRKANRTRLDSFMGIGDEKALKLLEKVKKEFDVSIVTDIHNPEEAAIAAVVADILQIPAFLCRQTDLLIAAAKTGKIVNIKKGQFSSPQSMAFAVDKIRAFNKNIMLTERGTTFGYQDLVVDFRSVPIMKKLGVPIVMDCTHCLQKPNQSAGVTGGDPELIGTMALAAIATGADGLFIETHPNPREALSDGANMLPLSEMETLLQKAVRVYDAIQIAE